MPAFIEFVSWNCFFAFISSKNRITMFLSLISNSKDRFIFFLYPS
jgi:hypothetical protein